MFQKVWFPKKLNSTITLNKIIIDKTKKVKKQI